MSDPSGAPGADLAAGRSGPIWIGIDLGTSGVRVLAVSGDGRILGRGERQLESRRTGSHHEQDPGAWWEAVAGASRQALNGVAPGRVRGVATCATSGTILLVDGRGEALTPALMYDDARAGDQAEQIGASPTSPRAKLAWLLACQPELAARARLAHQPDVVNRRLAGRAVPSDWSHALKSGYDLASGRWPPGAAAGLPAGLLPDVVRPGTRLGSVCAAAAADTGLPPGTPILAGMTDGCAAQIASGALGVGDWSSVLGTTLVLKGVSAEPIDDPGDVIYSHRAPEGEWLPGGASSAGAGALAKAFPGRDLDELSRAAAAHDTTDVLAYPLAVHGERFPFRAPGAEGFVVGEPTGEGELFAALLQGLAFVERLCFDVLDQRGAPIAGELTLSGGAAANRHLCQLRADALGRPVRLVEHGESAFGMAILAASRGCPLAETAARMVRVSARFEPRPARTEQLAHRYGALLNQLGLRGWLEPAAQAHALRRAAPTRAP